MDSSLPLISIGVSTYNRSELLIKSLKSFQAQTFGNFEIIVVDDGSTDQTAKVMQEQFPNIKYIYQENQGDAAAKNTAAKHANGEYLVFCDSDDLFVPDALDALYSQIKNKENSCSYSQYITIDINDIEQPTKYKLNEFPSGNILPQLIGKIIVNCCAVLMPLQLFKEIGGYDTTMRVGHDYKFALELANRSNMYATQKPLMLRRRHNNNLSSFSYAKINLILKAVEDFFTAHPELNDKYRIERQKRYANLHLKLAREAKNEQMDKKIIRQHLKYSLKNNLSAKALLRYLFV